MNAGVSLASNPAPPRIYILPSCRNVLIRESNTSKEEENNVVSEEKMRLLLCLVHESVHAVRRPHLFSLWSWEVPEVSMGRWKNGKGLRIFWQRNSSLGYSGIFWKICRSHVRFREKEAFHDFFFTGFFSLADIARFEHTCSDARNLSCLKRKYKNLWKINHIMT